MSSIIQIRRGTASEWTSANPILGQGEFGLELDTNKLKIGNAVTSWTGLTYFSLSFTDIYITGGTYSNGTVTLINNTGGTFNITGFISANTFVTGITNSNNNINLIRNDGVTLTTNINVLSGLTVNGSISATTISANSLTVSGITFNKLLLEKSGVAQSTGFTGNPKKYNVIFNSNFPNTNYGILITGANNRNYTWENQTISGFTINTNANTTFTNNVFWITKQIGET